MDARSIIAKLHVNQMRLMIHHCAYWLMWTLQGSVTSCLEICPRNAFLAPPGPHRSEGVAGTEMRAGRRK